MARIYTQRMQDVLEPIAQSISVLITKIEESEQDNVPLSDLTGPSAGVMTACKGLSNAGRSLCDGSDPVMDKEMPPAADSLDKAATSLNDACIALKNDPRSKSAKKQLEGGARGILEGTTKVLEVFDDQIVRRIVSSADLLVETLMSLSKTNDLKGLANVVKRFSVAAVTLARRTDSRCKELQQDQYREEVIRALADIKNLCPILVSASKSRVLSNQNVDAVLSASGVSDLIKRSAERIKCLVQLKFYRDQDLIGGGDGGLAQLAANAAYAALRSAMLGSPIDITKLKGDLSKLLTACEKIASICTNLADRDSLLYSIATTKEALSKFEQAADRFAANPSEAYAKTAYEMTAKELNEEVSDLQKKGLRLLAQEKERILSETGVTALEMTEAGKDGDMNGNQTAAKSLTRKADETLAMAAVAQSFANDASSAHNIEVAAQAVQSYTPLLCATARAVAVEKDSSNSDDHVDRMTQEYMNRLDQLSHAIDTAIEGNSLLAAAANEQAISDALPIVKTLAQKQDMPMYKNKLTEISERVRRMAKLCEAEADNSMDKNAANDLWEKAKALRDAADAYKNAAQKYYSAPKDKTAEDHLDSMGEALKNAVKASCKALGVVSASDLIAAERKAESEREERKREEQRRRAEEARNEELRRQREEEEKKAQAAAEAARLAELERLAAENAIKLVEHEEALKFQDNAIGNAAQQLHDEANQWDESQNTVVSLARLIAEKFNRMAAISSDPNSKRELIEIAKAIVEAAKSATKIALKYAENCADNRLKRELETTVSMMSSISAQLKIIAAVKASNYMNNEVDEQLTCCARNLMTAVQACVGQCHAASLKPIRKDDPLLISVQWRKKVYKNRPEAKW